MWTEQNCPYTPPRVVVNSISLLYLCIYVFACTFFELFESKLWVYILIPWMVLLLPLKIRRFSIQPCCYHTKGK